LETAGWLLPAVKEALARLEHALGPGAPFDPAASEHVFTIAAADYAQMVFLPPLLAALGRSAPGLRLHVRPVGEVELAAGLAQGVLDGAFGMFPRLAGSLLRKRLLRERFVSLVRRGHPAARGKLTRARFARLHHVQVAPLGIGASTFDEVLARHGLHRHITLRVPSFLVAPLVVAASDLVVTLPERVARAFARPFGLEMVVPPIEPPTFDVLQVWHERTAASPPHRFLRALVAEVAAGV
jgi:DNA-binding transcriptional LysR family regulator